MHSLFIWDEKKLKTTTLHSESSYYHQFTNNYLMSDKN